jgi:hypothetical protein
MEIERAATRCTVLVVSLAVALALPAAAHAATFNVASGDVPGLIAAINSANANGEADTINLAAGTYTLTSGPYDGAGLPAITTEIALVGAGAATTTIERAASGPSGPQFRLLTTSASAGARLASLTLHNGTTGVFNDGKLKIESCVLSHNGSGVYPAGELEVDDSTITDSTSLDPASGAIASGFVTVRNSQIIGNVGAALQGVPLLRLVDSLVQGNQYGIVVRTSFPSSSSFIEIVRSTIDANSATGIVLRNFYQDPIARAIITDSTISNNGGGGIALLGGTQSSDKRELIVRRSTISGNSTSGDGGGIFIEGSSVAPGGLAGVTIDSSTISGNHADGSGGAIFIAGGLRSGRRLQVIRSTITDNTADADANGSGDGGGIVTPLKVVDVEDSILAGNHDTGGEAPDCVGAITSIGHNVLGSTAGCSFALTSSDVVGAPLLGALAANGGQTSTHLPLPGSPAIDAADPARCGDPDQRALLRPSSGCDAGAVEVGATTPFAPVNDHFLCYDTKLAKGAAALPTVPAVSLVDDIESKSFDVKKTKALCTPADKNAEGVLDEATHLHSREIKESQGELRHLPHIGLRFATQLGAFKVDTLKVERLLVPTSVGIGAPLPAPNDSLHDVDRYKCYRVRRSSGTPSLPRGAMALSTLLGNQFTDATSFVLKKQTRLCTTVDENGLGRKNPDAQLLCFEAAINLPLRDGSKEPAFPGLFSTSEFGTENVDASRKYELCIPAVPLS